MFNPADSLKVSPHRPVSMDTNANSIPVPPVANNMKTAAGGGDGGGAVSYANAHSEVHPHRYSNRNSHPFTDRELEHGALHVEPGNGEDEVILVV